MAVYHAEGKTGNVRRIRRRKVRHLDFAPAEAKLSNTRRDAIAKEMFDPFAMDLGPAALQDLMGEEVNGLVGVKGRHRPDRTAWRHGVERGWISPLGRKIHVLHPRVRSLDGHEVVLETYVWAQHNEDSLTEAVIRRVLNGVITRRVASTLDAGAGGGGPLRLGTA